MSLDRLSCSVCTSSTHSSHFVWVVAPKCHSALDSSASHLIVVARPFSFRLFTPSFYSLIKFIGATLQLLQSIHLPSESINRGSSDRAEHAAHLLLLSSLPSFSIRKQQVRWRKALQSAATSFLTSLVSDTIHCVGTTNSALHRAPPLALASSSSGSTEDNRELIWHYLREKDEACNTGGNNCFDDEWFSSL